MQNALFYEDARIWKELFNSRPSTFGEAVQLIIDMKGISQEELASRAGIGRSTLRKWCSEKTSLQHAVALCIAMDVRADVGEELVRLAGLSFQRKTEHDIMYAMLFETRDLTVERANEILLQQSFSPLTCGTDKKTEE